LYANASDQQINREAVGDLQHEFVSVMDSLRCLFSWSSFVLHLAKGKRRSATLPTQDSMPAQKNAKRFRKMTGAIAQSW
jgi:hypothetical protein